MKRIRKVVLASESLQKKKIMIHVANELKLELVVNPANVIEVKEDDPVKTALVNALLKLREVNGSFVVSSDAFAYCEGEMLFKPKDKEDAIRILKKINENEVYVYTATAVKIFDFEITDITVSKLFMKSFSEAEIAKKSSNPTILKKAGAFSISDVLAVEGNIHCVMGLNTDFVKKMYFTYINELEHI